MRTLVAGWFSFQGMGATAGDLMARDLACDWLAEAGHAYDVAVVPPFATPGGVDWRAADPREYSHVLFVCGPFGNGPPVDEFLTHFRGRTMVGLDLTMLQALDEWNPFDVLFERDSSRACHPDLAFAAPAPRVPVVGVVLVHPQKEYKKTGLHAVANAAIHRLLNARPCARVHIDTCLDPWNLYGLRSAAEIEATIAACDVVVTTRLHGTVLAIKNGVPALAIDPVAGGAKLARQARVIEWPVVFTADAIDDAKLAEAFDFCLSDPARAAARQAAARARADLDAVRSQFVHAMRGGTEPEPG